MADNCAELSSEIAALRAEIARIPRVDENAIVRRSVSASEQSILPQIPAIASGIATAVASALITPLQPKIQRAIDKASEAFGLAEKGFSKASDAEIAASLAKAKAISSEATATEAIAKASGAASEALEANNAVGGLKGIVDGLKGRVGALGDAIARVERVAGEALQKAANAIGISNEALGAIGRLAGRVAEIFNILGTLAALVEQLATLRTLGARIDAVERGLEALGASVSGILGKLLGLQNRIAANTASIGEVRGIAENAKGIGEGAVRLAGDALTASGRAQDTATTAIGKAGQAQTTADGALRNANQANETAKTAYQKAIEAQLTATNATTTANNATAIANQATTKANEATNRAGEAFNKALEALGIALTALSLIRGLQLLRGLRGLPGIPGARGIPGIPGIRGDRGLPGLNGLDGVTTVVTLPGQRGDPGRDGNDGRPGVGFPGRNGVNGRNGVDAVPYNDASLRALILQQHSATRASVNATTTGLFGKLQAYIVGANAALTALITAIATNTYVEKALSLLTFAATIHNGLMLSNNLGQTLGTIVDQCVGLILPKGINGQPISISHVLGSATSDLIKNIIGANYNKISNEWAAANRIYQAGSNVFNQVGNAVGLLSSGMEMIGGNVGKIGNALKIWGVVGQHAYSTMNPQPNMHGKFFEFINTANAEASTIQMMVAIPIGLSAAAGAINSSIDQLAIDVNQKDPLDKDGNPLTDTQGRIIHYTPGITVQDPTVTMQAEAQSKADSTNIIAATIEDLFNAND